VTVALDVAGVAWRAAQQLTIGLNPEKEVSAEYSVYTDEEVLDAARTLLHEYVARQVKAYNESQERPWND